MCGFLRNIIALQVDVESCSVLFRYLNQGRRNQIDIDGEGLATVCTPRQFQNLEPPKYDFQRFGKLYFTEKRITD